jgi:hypothetical protein
MTHCTECKRPRPPTTQVVADAGQAYEQLDVAQATEAIDIILARARRQGYAAVSIRRTRQLQGTPVQNPYIAFRNSDTISFEDMRALLVAAMKLNVVQWGDTFWAQKGLGIGGLISKVMLSASLGVQEDTYTHTAHVLKCRYVDDIYAISRHLCCACLSTAVNRPYSTVTFDVQDFGDNTEVTWIDYDIHTDAVNGTIARRAAMLERSYLEARQSTHCTVQPEKQRVPPFHAAECVDWKDIRARFKGQFVRWEQQQLTPEALHLALANWLAIWEARGWPTQTVTRTARQVATQGVGDVLAAEARRAE